MHVVSQQFHKSLLSSKFSFTFNLCRYSPKQLNDIDMQVAELEGVVAALDRHTSSLEGRFKRLVTPPEDAWD